MVFMPVSHLKLRVAAGAQPEPRARVGALDAEAQVAVLDLAILGHAPLLQEGKKRCNLHI